MTMLRWTRGARRRTRRPLDRRTLERLDMVAFESTCAALARAVQRAG
jgi:hypothetical protein